MKINYCLPIIKENKNEILELIRTHQDEYQYFEIWLDHIEDPDKKFIDELTRNREEKLIFLFRRKNLEPIKMLLDKRFEIIKSFNNSPVLIDLDLSQNEEIDYIQKNDLKIKKIVSYHNYNETDGGKLIGIIDTMDKYSPDIYKIATFCRDDKDALTLMNLQQKLKMKNLRHIVLGMGDYGLITRIFATLWGNEMIFAPIKESETSAPGQLIKTDLENIFSLILNT